MQCPKPKLIGVATVSALVLALPTAAPASKQTLGRYSGKIAVDPATGSPGTLAFTVRHGRITSLTARERGILCIAPSRGSGVYGTTDHTLNTPKSWKIPIGTGGKFSFSGTVPGTGGTDLLFSGKVKGRKASGTIRFSFGHGPGVTCSMSEPIHFRAKR